MKILIIVLGALIFLMLVAYRGYSVILFAPVAALGAVLLTDPSLVPPMFSGVFMEKMVGFVKNYFPVFMLGAVFGKVIELSGFSKSIVSAVIGLIGRERAMLSIVLVCAILTYGGVSLFVVVFAVYPFAAEMFRQSDIPKRLIPCTIALGAFTFTMDALPGTPQIQNIIPTTFFKTTTWAAPWLGLLGSLFILAVGLYYIESRRRAAPARKRATARICATSRSRSRPSSCPTRGLPSCPCSGGRHELHLDQVDTPLLRPVHELTLGQLSRSSPRSVPWLRSGRSKARCCSAFSPYSRSPGARCWRNSPMAARRRSPAPCWPRSTPHRNMVSAA